uniref:Uncharacterized protein n=1 Tax=Corvus moneduloides TaxID=1196302 RepID=A0A8U7NPS1_CORMO
MGPQNALSQSERAALLTPHWSRLELPVQRGCFGAGGTCPALAMGRVAAAGAVLVALVVLGAPPAAGTELSGVFQRRIKVECHFINGTERVRFVQMHSYNREQYTHFDSDVGVCIRDTPDGEKQAWYWNSQLENPEYRWALVDMHCHYNYEIIARFLVSRRGEHGAERVLSVPSSAPRLYCVLCSEMDFYPSDIQVRWFQGQQELSGHVVATDIIPFPSGDWTHQLLVLLETPPGVGSPPLARWKMPPDAARSKMLTGIGDFVLGFVFLALGLGFYLSKKVRGGPGVRVPPPPELCAPPGPPSPVSPPLLCPQSS